jgi:hypothetical protein
MGLQRFERGLERLVEGVFAKTFRSGLQPVELGRRLAREMDLRRTVSVNGLVAPNAFLICLSPVDAQQFESAMDVLRRELVEAAREHARSERYSFVGPVSVEIETDEGLKAGMFLVTASLKGQPGGGPIGSLSLNDGRRIRLSDDGAVIGRLPECDVSLPDPNVSRRHAQVKRHGNEFVVSDLGSTNGTRVNGTQVSGERRLHDGDEIGVGATIIRFEGS